MRKILTESLILFLSIIKWVFLATVAGLIVGTAVALFLKILNFVTELILKIDEYFLFLPLGLFISGLLVKYFAPDAEGHGTEKVIEAVHKRSGKIPANVVPVKLLATLITLSTGGSAGKEGPCAQIGAGLTSLLSDLFKFDNYDRKKLVICGISAGFASVFGTPIAGSIFGIEVLFVGAMLYDVLLPSFVAGITAYEVSSALGISYFYHPISIITLGFPSKFLLKVMISGIFFGFCSIYIIMSLKIGKRISDNIKVWSPLKGIIGGAFLQTLALIFSTKYLGLGLETIENSLKGESTDWFSFLLKPIFTSITLNFGGSGGIVTPIFFIGATAGTTFANLFNLNSATFAAIGMVSLLAGAANTPIAASILAIELFGPSIAPYAALACIISFLITGHRSVYPSQILSISKSAELKVEIGKEIEKIRTVSKFKKKGFITALLQVIKKIEKTINKIEREIKY